MFYLIHLLNDHYKLESSRGTTIKIDRQYPVNNNLLIIHLVTINLIKILEKST